MIKKSTGCLCIREFPSPAESGNGTSPGNVRLGAKGRPRIGRVSAESDKSEWNRELTARLWPKPEAGGF